MERVRRPHGRARSLQRLLVAAVVFLAVSALSGVLTAGLVLPVVGTLGLSAKAASDHFEDLPVDFRNPVLPQRTRILAADGSVIAQTWGDYGNRVVVPMSKINPVMPHALVAIEDARFYQHGGFDLTGTLRAFLHDAGGGSLQGGSTIAQQYVKNVLLLEAGTNTAAQQAATADTLARKVTELKDAVAVEQQLTRQQLLSRYLNLVYFGNDAYGVEAAAERYFSTSAAALTVPQAALLAALVNSPSLYDPFIHPQDALARRNLVLAKMTDPTLGYLTKAQAAQYQATPLGLHPSTPADGCITATGSAAFFCNYVYTTFLSDPAFGATGAARKALWNRGGLSITTTMQPAAEKAADHAIAARTRPTDKIATALAEIQPGTGKILAMAQSKPMGSGPGATFLNLAADPQHSGSGGYQAGSSFKIFVGLAALIQGIDPNQSINARSPLTGLGGTSLAACYHGAHSIIWPNSYTPSNDDHQGHNTAMPQAYRESINTYFLTLETKTGLCRPAQIAADMGVTLDNDNGAGKPLAQIASFTLGTNPVTPIEMAGAYATLADQGTYCAPYVITAVAGPGGIQYPAQRAHCRQVLDPNVANALTAMLQGVLNKSDGTAYGSALTGGRPAAGKTGTTDSSIATWFDGYTPQLATAVWTGFINPKLHDFLGNMHVGGTYYSGQIYGATISAPIWKAAMDGTLSGQPAAPFTAPTGPFTGLGSH